MLLEQRDWLVVGGGGFGNGDRVVLHVEVLELVDHEDAGEGLTVLIERLEGVGLVADGQSEAGQVDAAIHERSRDDLALFLTLDRVVDVTGLGENAFDVVREADQGYVDQIVRCEPQELGERRDDVLVDVAGCVHSEDRRVGAGVGTERL